MKKDEIVKKYAFLMLLVGTALAFLVGSGIFFGILCLANSSIAGSIALNIGGLMGITAFIAIPIYFLGKY